MTSGSEQQATSSGYWRVLGGPLLAVLVGLWGASAGMPAPALFTLMVTAFCVGWWLLEAVPMAATAMLPLALFPLAGVLEPGEVAAAYGSPVILLMLGGFMLSKAMERSQTHYRLAVLALHAVGGSSERRLVVGFMVAAAGLSMWISNTATTLMLLPVALALLERIDSTELRVPLMLGIPTAPISAVSAPRWARRPI